MNDAGNTEMPPPTAPYGGDPKAAKAYVKASRKWYQKKRWWAAIVLVIIVAASAAGKSGGSGPSVVSDGAKETPSSKSSDVSKPGTKENPVKIGTTVELAGTRYTVRKVTTAKTLGDVQFGTGAKANGRFVEVTLTIENMKNETKTFLESAAKVKGGNGASYDTDSNGTMAAITGNAQPLMLADMQPQLPKTGVLVFDLPVAALKGAVLEVSDLFGDGSAYIALGLK